MNQRFLKKIVLFFTISIIFQSCFTMRDSDRKTKKIFEKKNLTIAIDKHNLQTVDYKVRVVSRTLKENKDIAIFFVHGAPGSSSSYHTYLQDSLLLSKANLYSIDRPGYGYSNFGKSEVSIEKQARVVAEIIESLPEENVIVLGHSYGGPIAAYSSLLSTKIKSVLMLAPAIDPENEFFFKIAYFAKWKLTKWMVPGALAIAGDEKFAHIKELTKIKDTWKNVEVPIIHVHGNKDVVVPFENLDFSKNSFNEEYLNTIILDEENHFIPWSQYGLVKEELLKLIHKI